MAEAKEVRVAKDRVRQQEDAYVAKMVAGGRQLMESRTVEMASQEERQGRSKEATVRVDTKLKEAEAANLAP